MKTLALNIFILLAWTSNAQTIEETTKIFWKAIDEENDEKSKEKGEQLILQIDSINSETDSNIIKIRLNTAEALSNLGNTARSIELNLKTLEMCRDKWGDSSLYLASTMNNLGVNYYEQGHYNKSLNVNLIALSIRKKTLGIEHSDYASSLNKVADNYSDLGKYSKSLELNIVALNIRRRVFGEEHHDYAESLNSIALNYSDLGNHTKSLETNLKANEIYERVSGTDHSDYLTSLDNIASNYSDLGYYDSALKYALKVLRIRKKTLRKEHPDYARSLNNTAVIYSYKGNYNKSLKLNLIALGIREKTIGKEHPDYLTSLSNTAIDYSDLGKNNKYHELILKVLEITGKTLGEKHPDYAKALNNTAASYSYLGKPKKSLKMNKKALKIREQTIGKGHPDYATSLNNIAVDYLQLGDYKKALEINLEELKILEITLGKSHPSYVKSINNIAIAHSYLGDYNRSLEYNLIALEIKEKAFGKNHPSYAKSISNIADDYSDLGEYGKALQFNLMALEIREKKNGKFHPDYAMVLNNTAVSYSNLGDYKKSLELKLLAMQIRAEVLGKDHPDYANSLNSIALNYSNTGHYNKSLELNLNTLEIRKKTIGKFHPDYAVSLNNIAQDYSNLGMYKKALKLNTKELKITAKNLGKKHPDYAKSLNNIAAIYSNLKNYKKALKLNLKAIGIYESTIGKRHPSYALSLVNTAISYSELGDNQSALKFLNYACEIGMQSYTNNRYGSTPTLKALSKESIELNYQYLASLSFINESNIEGLHNIWIELNGFIGSDQSQFKEILNSTKDSLLQAIFNDLKLSQLQLGKYNDMTIQERVEKEIDSKLLEKHIVDLESELSKRSIDFAEMNRSFSSQDAIKALSENEILVEIVRFPYFDFRTTEWSDSVKYLVFFTDSKRKSVNHLFINIGKELEGEVFNNYSSYTSETNKMSNRKDEVSYKYFWKPIADKIGNHNIVYVSLSGVYNTINLNTMYNAQTNKYLIEEKDIRIVNSTREFILNKEREVKAYTSNTAVLFGFPNYNRTSTISIDYNDQLTVSSDLNSFWINSLNRGGLIASLLPETRIEVENIKQSFKNKNWNVSSFIENKATESSLKIIHSPRVLHIATHGYFFENIPQDKENKQFMGVNRNKAMQDPMLRSGLLFSGANKTISGEKTQGDNGLLSAREASLLDLSNTELVVLSACETGKGEVQNSEGVFGLRKAFSDAGAENIIMSLWKVDDKVTQEFMTDFYSIWLSGKTIREAFNETQLKIKEKYPQPYYWGAFILVGK